jgi:hypothetical protein
MVSVSLIATHECLKYLEAEVTRLRGPTKFFGQTMFDTEWPAVLYGPRFRIWSVKTCFEAEECIIIMRYDLLTNTGSVETVRNDTCN